MFSTIDFDRGDAPLGAGSNVCVTNVAIFVFLGRPLERNSLDSRGQAYYVR
jgi:hypothetical protein